MGRENLKGSQGQGNRFPRIEVEKRLRVKDNPENGKVSFEYWDGDKKIFYTNPIMGIFIGAVNTMQCFDQNYGSKGGSYKTSYYTSNNDNIVVFDPAFRKCFTGTKEQINTWAASMQMEKFSSKKHLIVLSRQGGVVDVESNMILFIDQINKLDKDTFMDYFIKLSPMEFDVATNPLNVSANGIKYLGPFAAKNKPKFAFIERGDPLTDEIYDSFGGDGKADEAVEMFKAWKEFTSAGNVVEEEHPGNEMQDNSQPAYYQTGDMPMAPPEQHPPDNLPEPPDNEPF